MSIEPEFLPPRTAPSLEPQPQTEIPEIPWLPGRGAFRSSSAPPAPPPKKARRIPNLGHTILFVIVTLAVLFLTEIAAFALAMGLQLFGKETPQQMFHEPRLLIPSMAISYILAGAICWAIFTHLWNEPFSLGIRWNSLLARRRFVFLLFLGVLLSIGVQLLSNYLPIPKTLPIDDFFRTRADIWLVAIFGTFLAPPFEELAFRGFMLPSLATAWDWTMRRRISDAAAGGLTPGLAGADGSRLQEIEFREMEFQKTELRGTEVRGTDRDPRWSPGALVFSSILTSIVFAMLHADQLAHSWTPLSILFGVSLVLCLVRLRTQSLAASALVHAVYNGTIFVILFIATDGFRHLDKINQ
jgi:uncharacterized protein